MENINKLLDYDKIMKIEFGDKEMYIKQSHTLYRLKYENMISASAERPYTLISTTDKNIYIDMSLTKLEKKLPDTFFRCSRKNLVNLTRMLAYKESDGNLYMDSGKVYNVSFRRRKHCMKRIDRMISTQFL
jgi:DNA-binding LytR/AlgR family response regulator